MRVSFIAFEGVQSLDVFGPMEVFALANTFAGKQFYETNLYTIDARKIKTNCGIEICCEDISNLLPTNTFIFCGGDERALINLSYDDKYKESIVDKTKRSSRICSICTGSFVLAYLGFLNGKRATTHWRHASKFREMWPKVKIIDDDIFVKDGNIYTSAGVSCGIDLCLSLVEDDLGYEISKSVAKELVLYLRRSGGQKQYSDLLNMQDRNSSKLDEVCDYIISNPKADLSISKLATKFSMSERNFSRRFKKETNSSPAVFVEVSRLNLAKTLLETTDMQISVIAHEAGFGNENNFFRSFSRELGITPNQYKQRFSRISTK